MFSLNPLPSQKVIRVCTHVGKTGISWNLNQYIPDMEYHVLLKVPDPKNRSVTKCQKYLS